MTNRFVRSIALLCVPFVSSCINVPPRDGLARVHVDNVIKRIKCDIRNSIKEEVKHKSADGRSYPLAFISQWAAKIHLTISVDDTASINPGATIINPLHGPKPQSFSLGLGVGMSTEAIRTEDIEFLISFPELTSEFEEPGRIEHYDVCKSNDGILLESDLHLDSLINSALEPVYNGTLYIGHDIGPGAAGAAIPASEAKALANLEAIGNAPAKIQGFKPDNKVSFNDLAKRLFNSKLPDFVIDKYFKTKEGLAAKLNQAGETNDVDVDSGRHLLSNASEATMAETRTQAIINNIVKPLYTIAAATDDKQCLTNVSEAQDEAITWSAGVSLSVIDVENPSDKDATKAATASDTALQKVTTAEDSVVKSARNLANELKSCKAAGKPAPKMYDPIDEIAETVNFYITDSGSVTPTWKLVQVTAPLAPTFLSASRKDTNTLILTMGRPIVGDDGTVTASPAMNNQILSSILTQSLTNAQPHGQ